MLGPSDQARLEAFLRQHRDSSMLLRANLRVAGMAYRGERLQAEYAAAIKGGAIVGVVGHAWNGMLLVQAPRHVEALGPFCVARSGRMPTGLIGPLAQVVGARAALGLADAPARKEDAEGLFVLDLGDLVLPEVLSSPDVECRVPHPSERDTLLDWRVAYDIEALGGADTPDGRQRATGFLDSQLADGHVRVALVDGRLVSLAAFNAVMPEIVQLGGIYTPPEQRGRGYARAAIAALLLDARQRGVERAVLFAGNPSAIRCYERLGFTRVGDFGLVLLD